MEKYGLKASLEKAVHFISIFQLKYEEVYINF